MECMQDFGTGADNISFPIHPVLHGFGNYHFLMILQPIFGLPLKIVIILGFCALIKFDIVYS